MRRTGALIGLLALASCIFTSVSARQIVGPDGKNDWWNIECQLDDTLCWRRASEQCPRGYDAVDRPDGGEAKVYARKNAAGEMFGERRVSGGTIVVHCTDGTSSREPSVDDVTGSTRPLADPR